MHPVDASLKISEVNLANGILQVFPCLRAVSLALRKVWLSALRLIWHELKLRWISCMFLENLYYVHDLIAGTIEIKILK